MQWYKRKFTNMSEELDRKGHLQHERKDNVKRNHCPATSIVEVSLDFGDLMTFALVFLYSCIVLNVSLLVLFGFKYLESRSYGPYLHL